MPSGVELTGLVREARCMQCHHGRESTVSVNAFIEEIGVDEDTVSEDLSFRNIHYFPAGATRFGTEAQGGYEYAGNSYAGFFPHMQPYDSCTECHSAHQPAAARTSSPMKARAMQPSRPGWRGQPTITSTLRRIRAPSLTTAST